MASFATGFLDSFHPDFTIYDTDTVEIYDGQLRVATHKRCFTRNDRTSLPEHRPEAHQKYVEELGYDQQYFLREAKKIGTCTLLYIERVLKSKNLVEQTYDSCLGILRLSKNYPPERVEKACNRALQGGSATLATLKKILTNKADLLVEQLDPAQSEFQLPDHENIRGSKAYC